VDFLEACRKIIGIDSSPAAGTLEVAKFIETLANEMRASAPMHVELQVETWNGVDQANVIIRPLGASPPNSVPELPEKEIMLQTHLDTPDPGAYALWNKTGANPFNASIYQSVDGDMIHGLGSADVKLDFLCKLYALRDVIAGGIGSKDWVIPPVLVGTFGEELGMPGAVRLIRKKKIRPTAVLVGEPTAMQLVVAGKGFASVEIEIPFSEEERKFRSDHDLSESSSTQSRLFSGRAAHSSAPQLGESAIIKMLDALERLPSGLATMEIEGGVNFNTVASQAVLEIDMVSTFSNDGLRTLMAQKIVRIRSAIKKVEEQFRKFPDAEFLPQEPTMNIGMIRTLEDHVKLSGCVRLPPTVSHTDYEGWMRDLRVACAAEDAVFRIGDYKQPFRTRTNSKLVEVCKDALLEMGIDAALGAQAVANEANVFAKFGLDCAVWGPGQGVGNSHTPNEYVRIPELDRAIEFYRKVISRMCL
jgi:acetylornithine deacetylase/succinyl-diaminopimelate desuccinylase-like protein